MKKETGEAVVKFLSVLLASILVGCVAGCYGTESGQKQITDPSRIDQIQKGVSTKASIRAAFGAPEGIDYAANGDEVWSYSYINASMDPASYIPVVGMFAFGGSTQSCADSYFRQQGSR